MTTIQIRIEEGLKQLAIDELKIYGMGLSKAIRLFLEKVVLEKGIPFNTSFSRDEYQLIYTLVHDKEMGLETKKDGKPRMMLDEINEEIAIARKERKK